MLITNALLGLTFAESTHSVAAKVTTPPGDSFGPALAVTPCTASGTNLASGKLGDRRRGGLRACDAAEGKSVADRLPPRHRPGVGAGNLTGGVQTRDRLPVGPQHAGLGVFAQASQRIDQQLAPPIPVERCPPDRAE